MVIEFVILVIGVIFSFYLEFKSDLSAEMKNLLCNLSIGLSTGNMVAFLIEIPQTISLKKQNLSILTYNSFYIYMYFNQLASEIEKLLNNQNNKYNNSFTKYYFEKIAQHILPVLNLDEKIFCFNIKNTKIKELKKELNYFKTINIQSHLTSKFCTILLESKDSNSLFTVTNGMVAPELKDLLVKINTYIKLVDDVMKLALNKKQLKKWTDDTIIIRNCLYNTDP